MSHKIKFGIAAFAGPSRTSVVQTSATSPRLSSSPVFYLAMLALIVALSASPFLGHSPAAALGSLEGAPSVEPAFGRLPLAFVPNQGQIDTSARFEARGVAGTLGFAPQEIVLTVPDTPDAVNAETLRNSGQTLRLRFLDANPAPAVDAGRSLPGTANYYLGSDATQWYTNLPTYADINYRHLYPGIDLRYEGTDGQLKSTFFVAPGADPARIHWQYSGAEAVTLESATGNLRIGLPGQAQVVEQAPVAWQQVDGRRIPVAVAYAVAGDGGVGFELGSYDVTAPLIIDPTIVYETIIGGATSGIDIAVDTTGNAYVIARVYDTNNDVMVAKLSADGALQYTTYLRGSSGDFGTGIALDGSGDVYIAGGTDSSDFPILNAMQLVKNGVTRDAFIAKLAAQDGSLLFSTYFGGSRSDIIQDITLNSVGQIYLVGYTESTDFPTLNPIQGGLNLNQCFCEDTFVTKLSPDALTVLYSTYLGGSFEDYGQSIALDGDDNIYITGRTQSDDFPTQAAIQPDRAGELQDEDLFVSKISADGSSLVYSTYLGGIRNEAARRIAVDSAGNAFVAGSTLSTDFPTTAGAYRDAYIGGRGACLSGFGLPVDCNDMFVTKFVPDGSSLAYSTYLGGSLHDYANGIAINDAGEAYAVGYTHSTDFPGVTRTELGYDIVLAKLNANGSDLLYTVIINSPVANQGHGIAVDNAGDVYITGAQNAPSNLYVAKISDGGAPPPTSTPTLTPVPPTPTPTLTPSANQPPVAVAWANPESGEAPLTVQFSSDGSNDPDGSIVGYAWDFGDGGSSSDANPGHTYTEAGTYNATLTVTDDDGASQSDTVVITVTGASQDELHVQDQTVTRQTRGNRARAVDRVLITDQNNQPVTGATVTAVFSGPNQGQVSGVTKNNGIVVLSTDVVRNPQGVWCFEVTNVSKDGYVYNPAANVVTVQCE
jgi:PKD repeat protein